MKDRTFRFGFTGILFILSVSFGFWYLGGSPTTLFNINDKIIPVIIGIISTPIIGFILSSINVYCWETLWPGEKLFQEPPKEIEQEYLKMVYEVFPSYSGIIYDEKEKKYIIDKAKLDILLTTHQALMRKVDNKEAMEFSSRRLDTFYVHLNCIYTIFWGTLIGILINLLSKQNHGCLSTKGLIIIPILFYFFVGHKHAIQSQKESNEFEKKFLLYHYTKKDAELKSNKDG